MKSLIALGSAIVLAALIIGAAVAVTRPEWLPAAVRNRLPLSASASESEGEADFGLYCDEHGVPEKFCTLCHEELNKSLIICEEHGNIPEDICTKCHPDAEKKNRITMCPNVHGLPKEFCSECGKVSAASASKPDDGWCASHNKPEALCKECLLDPGSHDAASPGGKTCRQPLPTVRIASARLADQVGIRAAAAAEEILSNKLEANAEAAYNSNRFADITPRVSGFLREIRADLGRVVKRGEILAVVDSAEVSAVKAQYITALAEQELAQVRYDRTRPLARTGSLPAKTELETLTALNQAKASSLDAGQRLRNFGFDDAELARIIKENDTNSTLNILAPLDGVVVERHAVKGEPVQATAQIFSVTDTSAMWLWVDVYESDIGRVKVGQEVGFRVSGYDDAAFAGKVNWIGTEVNPQTRTTRIRVELANPEGKLRANQFGQAEIQVEAAHKAVVVPKAAVQRKDDADVVFLPQEEAGVFVPQRVVTKLTDRGDFLEVAWGLKPGQRVVTKGAFLLKTEIMKGAIGAGCCE